MRKQYKLAWRKAGRTVAAVATTAAMVLSTPGVALACTQVYMGSALTANGDTIYGREEDYAARHVKVFGVQEATDGKDYISAESDFTRHADHTYRYTYVRDTEADWGAGFPPYSEAGVNEKGVTCSATLTTDANADVMGVDPETTAGLGEYNLADVVLGESATAREGVELLGQIMDEVGTAEHNQILIGDNNETWVFMQLSGHQWCAVKLADDVASVNPNMGNLAFDVDIDDDSVCLHSADMVKVAKDAGTYVEFDDGHMNVAASYGEPGDDSEAGSGMHQYTRYAQGRHYLDADLTEPDYELDEHNRVTSISEEGRQLFFAPGRDDWSLYDMQRLLAARGEGTRYDANTDDRALDPENGIYSIGNNRGVESHLFQARHGMDADIATIQWEALSRTEFSVYVPVYSALLTEVPVDVYSTYDGIDQTHTGEGVSPIDEELSGEMYDDPEAAMADGGNNLDYVLMDLTTLAFNNREKTADGVAAYLKALQTEVNAQQEEVDALMQSTPAGDARTELANLAFADISRDVYNKCFALRAELREYLAGDQAEPFAASDLADDGTLAEPLEYAEQVKAGETVDEIDSTEPVVADEGSDEGSAAVDGSAAGSAAVEAGTSTNSTTIMGFVIAAIVVVALVIARKKGGPAKPEETASGDK